MKLWAKNPNKHLAKMLRKIVVKHHTANKNKKFHEKKNTKQTSKQISESRVIDEKSTEICRCLNKNVCTLGFVHSFIHTTFTVTKLMYFVCFNSSFLLQFLTEKMAKKRILQQITICHLVALVFHEKI